MEHDPKHQELVLSPRCTEDSMSALAIQFSKSPTSWPLNNMGLILLSGHFPAKGVYSWWALLKLSLLRDRAFIISYGIAAIIVSFTGQKMNTFYGYITQQDPAFTKAVENTCLIPKPGVLCLCNTVSTHFYNTSLLVSSPSFPPTQSKFSPVSLWSEGVYTWL